MEISNISKENEFKISMVFEANEKCFCCSKVFSEKTRIVRSFKNKEELNEHLSVLKFEYGIDLTNNK